MGRDIGIGFGGVEFEGCHVMGLRILRNEIFILLVFSEKLMETCFCCLK